MIRKLSASEVKAFQTLLEQQRFPNLNKMRYLNEAVFADYPSTRLEIPGIQLDYVDLELANLPRGLRRIVNAWQALIQ
ncbi:MAG: hypothetical protein HC824_08935 [Synechococcales cyanobacterium RM1_1_8]|nr:hypothetical protein [Synechococcales cyanobacterium RM1_1_8]